MSVTVRIGVVDSGCADRHRRQVAEGVALIVDGSGIKRTALQPDRLGHGSRVSDILLHLAPEAELLVAQVFQMRPSTTALQVAAAIDWLVERGAALINLSLGLAVPRPVLAQACANAIEAGVVLCASVPSIPRTVYPAAFPGVFKVTGDARCGRAEISALAAAHADFGAHVRPLDGGLAGAGASLACAHLSAIASRHLAAVGSAAALRQWLQQQARYHGMEDLRSLQRSAGHEG